MASVELNAPRKDTGYPQRLEVLMVQELHFWFHNHCVSIAALELDILEQKKQCRVS